jgi:hypothetical protein
VSHFQPSADRDPSPWSTQALKALSKHIFLNRIGQTVSSLLERRPSGSLSPSNLSIPLAHVPIRAVQTRGEWGEGREGGGMRIPLYSNISKSSNNTLGEFNSQGSDN